MRATILLLALVLLLPVVSAESAVFTKADSVERRNFEDGKRVIKYFGASPEVKQVRDSRWRPYYFTQSRATVDSNKELKPSFQAYGYGIVPTYNKPVPAGTFGSVDKQLGYSKQMVKRFKLAPPAAVTQAKPETAMAVEPAETTKDE